MGATNKFARQFTLSMKLFSVVSSRRMKPLLFMLLATFALCGRANAYWVVTGYTASGTDSINDCFPEEVYGPGYIPTQHTPWTSATGNSTLNWLWSESPTSGTLTSTSHNSAQFQHIFNCPLGVGGTAANGGYSQTVGISGTATVTRVFVTWVGSAASVPATFDYHEIADANMYIGGDLGDSPYYNNDTSSDGAGDPSIKTLGPSTLYPPDPDYYNFDSTNGTGAAQSIPVPVVNGVRATTFDFAVNHMLTGQSQWVIDGGVNPQMTVTSTYTVQPNLGASPTPTPPIKNLPPYADPNFCPDCGGSVAGCGGSGASAGDPVNPANGQESYEPVDDLRAYSPSGLNAAWQRSFSTQQSLNGYGTPGLAQGWVSNSDVFVTNLPGVWGTLTLHYPNGSYEYVTPQTNSNGQPTGNFTCVAGAPYIVTGIPGSTTGSWNNLTVTWKQQAQWTFKPLSGTPSVLVLDRIIDKLGYGNSFAWDASRRLQSVTDVASGTVLLTLTYNASGYLNTVTDAYNRQIAYTFAKTAGFPSAAELTQVSQIVPASTYNPPLRSGYAYASYTVPATSTTVPLMASISVPSPTGSGLATASLTYDTQGRVASHIDANGNIDAYTYNPITANGGSTLIQTKNPQGVVVLSYTQNFDAKGRETGTTDSAGNSNVIVYGDTANPYQATSVSDAMGRTSTMTYDGFGNVLTSTSPRNIKTTYSYDYSHFALGRLVQVQEGSKPPVSMSYYEPVGLPQSVTAPNPTGSGTVTSSMTYDSLGNVLTTTTPGNDAVSSKTTTFNYTTDGSYSQAAKAGQPLTMTDNLGHVTHFRYDARGNVVSSWDALGNTTTIAYNLADQPTDTYAPPSGQTGSGQTHLVTSYLYVDGPQTSTRLYDESGALFRTVNLTYGPEGEVLGNSGDTTASATTYDALYHIKTLRDSNNNLTTYSYNALGEVTQMAYPGADGSGKDTISYTNYDASGLLLQSVDGRGHITNYTYNDAEGQLTNISYPSSPSENVSYVYDAYGLPQSVTDSTGTRTYTLNTSDVLTQVSTVFKKLDGTLSAAKNISYTYNADGSRATMTTPAGNYAYGHDGVGNWTGLQDHQGGITHWNYDVLNRLTRQTTPLGTQTNFTYNALSQLVGLSNLNVSGNLLSKFGHESDPTQMLLHDAAGNLKREVASDDMYSSARFFAGTVNYSYDNKDQLTNETSTRNGGVNNSFGYDAIGNPVSWKGQARTFNANNQETTGGTTNFAYDGNGNATTYQGYTNTFNESDKLTSVTSHNGYTSVGQPTSTATFFTAGYRSDGLRAWKSGLYGTTYFLYDGSQLVCEFDGNLNLNKINVWGADGLLGRQSGILPGTPINFYLWDDRGNIAESLNGNGSVATNFNVTSFGDVTRDQSSYDAYYGLGGQFGNYLDVETGLVLCGQRYYDSSAGRWINRDPISYEGGLNVYGYVGNNPTNASDPMGLEPLTLAAASYLSAVNGTHNGIAYIFIGKLDGSAAGPLNDWAVKHTVDFDISGQLGFFTDAGFALGNIRVIRDATRMQIKKVLENPSTQGFGFCGHGDSEGFVDGDGNEVTPSNVEYFLGARYKTIWINGHARVVRIHMYRQLKAVKIDACEQPYREWMTLVRIGGAFYSSQPNEFYVGGWGGTLPAP